MVADQFGEQLHIQEIRKPAVSQHDEGHSNRTAAGDVLVRPAVRIGAIGDLHVHAEIPEELFAKLREVDERVDMFIIAGDLTEGGRLPEGELASAMLRVLHSPKFAVLGNHDRRGPRRVALRRVIESAGVTLLDGDALVIELPSGLRIGLAGVGGYGGGFWPEEAPEIPGARLSKAVGVRARREAARLEKALTTLSRHQLSATIVVMHYAPTTSTLGEEPPLKYWMLGNSLLGRVIDAHDVDLVIHGHAHLGNEIGQTPGGTPVRNVAFQVTGGPVIYNVSQPQIVETVYRTATPPDLVDVSDSIPDIPVLPGGSGE